MIRNTPNRFSIELTEKEPKYEEKIQRENCITKSIIKIYHKIKDRIRVNVSIQVKAIVRNSNNKKKGVLEYNYRKDQQNFLSISGKINLCGYLHLIDIKKLDIKKLDIKKLDIKKLDIKKKVLNRPSINLPKIVTLLSK